VLVLHEGLAVLAQPGVREKLGPPGRLDQHRGQPYQGSSSLTNEVVHAEPSDARGAAVAFGMMVGSLAQPA
jgi:hypothetical protein